MARLHATALLSVLALLGCSSSSVAPDSAVERGPARDLPAGEVSRQTERGLPATDGPRGDHRNVDGKAPQPDASLATWQKVAAPSAGSLTEVHGASANDVWAVGSAILHFDGQTWAVRDPIAASGVWAASATDAWAVEGGTRRRYDGAAWKTFDTTAGAVWLDVWGTAANNVWTVGLAAGSIPFKGVVGRFDGQGWSKIEQPDLLESIAGSSAQNIWAVGQAPAGGGAAWRLSGSTWTSVPPSTSLSLHGVWAVSASDVWAVGEQQILHYDGGKWNAATPPSLGKGWLVDIWGSSASSLWAVGYADRDTTAGTFGSGIVYRYDGAAWTPVATPAINAGTPPLFAIWGASATDVWAVGQSGTILRYH